MSAACLQQSLRDLQSAFARFFNKTCAYPRFKKKGGRQSANFARNGFQYDPLFNEIRMPYLGTLDVRWSRPLPSSPTSVRILRKPSGRYFVSVVVEVPTCPWPSTGAAVGVDFGTSRLATLSTGETVSNPKHGYKLQKRLAHYQRLSRRKQPGSGRLERSNRRAARVYEQIVDRRTDTLHKFTTDLVRRFDTVCIETLSLPPLLKNHGMARSLSDASLGLAAKMLEGKAERYGRTLVRVDRFFPSTRMCSACGHVREKLPLSVRSWECPKCGRCHDRDVNAAVNIVAVGQTVSAHGGGVRAGRS